MTEEVKLNTMPVLFIGGPKDGERVECSELPPVYPVSVRNPHFNALINPVEASEAEVNTTMMLVQVTYRREAFRTAAGLYPVYVFEEIPQQDVMHILLDGYRPAAETTTKH